MKNLLLLLLVLTISACASQSKKAENAHTPETNKTVYYFTKEGKTSKQQEGSEYYRKLLEINTDGTHLVQGFYTEGDKKQTDPVLMLDGNELDAWDPKNLQGVLIIWSKAGHKEALLNYKKGKKEGVQRGWYENGNKEVEATFVNGVASGLFTTWHENGEKESMGEMLNDQYEGLWAFWDKKGIKKEFVFSKGAPFEGIEL